jgi:hypothetical protein
MTARLVIVFIAIFIACATSTLSRGTNQTRVEVIPLHVTQPEPGTYKPEVDVLIDGHRKRFTLDSGARKTSVFSDRDTCQYPVIAEDKSGGAFGKVNVVDVIQPRKLEIGRHVFLNPRLQRTGANRKTNLLGMDLLAENPFQIDLKNATLNLMAGASTELLKEPIHRLTGGHFAIPISLGKKHCYALFDTGAERTTIDLQFVNANSQLFKLIRTERGTDSIGHEQETPIYQVGSVQVGNLRLNNVDMASYDFGDEFRKKLEGVPIILGSNVIYHAKWSFDIKRGLWAVEPNK